MRAVGAAARVSLMLGSRRGAAGGDAILPGESFARRLARDGKGRQPRDRRAASSRLAGGGNGHWRAVRFVGHVRAPRGTGVAQCSSIGMHRSGVARADRPRACVIWDLA